jgi:hypothetical protein
MPPITLRAGCMLEEDKNPHQESTIVHHCRSTSASAAAASGSQKVMSMARYNALAVESAAREEKVSGTFLQLFYEKPLAKMLNHNPCHSPFVRVYAAPKVVVI